MSTPLKGRMPRGRHHGPKVNQRRGEFTPERPAGANSAAAAPVSGGGDRAPRGILRGWAALADPDPADRIRQDGDRGRNHSEGRGRRTGRAVHRSAARVDPPGEPQASRRRCRSRNHSRRRSAPQHLCPDPNRQHRHLAISSASAQELNPALIFCDEAHLYVTEIRKRLLDQWPNARRIGLTATPPARTAAACV